MVTADLQQPTAVVDTVAVTEAVDTATPLEANPLGGRTFAIFAIVSSYTKYRLSSLGRDISLHSETFARGYSTF